MASETSPFSLDLIYRFAFHTSWIKKYFSKDSASQKYSQPLQLQKHIRAKNTLAVSPYDIKANGFTRKGQRPDLSYSLSYVHSFNPQTKIHLFVRESLMMCYMLINDKFRKGQFSIFPVLFYSYCLNSPSNGTTKPRESLILAVSTTRNCLHIF